MIVIDDKSTEGQEIYAKLKKDECFKHVVFLKNNTDKKGAGTCRNLGIQHAQGKWLLFADSDDYFIEGWYEVIKKYIYSSNDVVFFKPVSAYIDSGEVCTRHKHYEARIENYQKKKDLESELALRYKMYVPWSKMIKREFVIQNNIFFEEVIVSNDLLFSTKVGYYMKNFTVSDEIIYVVTRNFNSLTVDISESLYDIRLNEKVKYYNFLKINLSENELKILNVSFLDFLLKSYRYGVGKFIKIFYYVIKNRLPLLDNRLLNIKSLSILVKTYIDRIKDKKYYKS